MDRHEIPEADGGAYVVERSPAGIYGLTYRYPDGRSIPASPDYADWMPEVLRLAERERALEEAHTKGGTYIALLEERVRELEVERDAKEATIHMAVARLGGLVEGRPTHRINFLQRIDALRKIEARERKLREALEPLTAEIVDLLDSFSERLVEIGVSRPEIDSLRTRSFRAEDALLKE